MKNILFVTSEAVPFIKTGGLADVAGSLPKAFNKNEFDVRVILPKYRIIPDRFKEQMHYVTHFYMDLGWQNHYVGVLTMEYEGVTFYFIDNEHFFSGIRPMKADNGILKKFAIIFQKPPCHVLPLIGFRPDIVHCHDWQTGLVPVFLKDSFLPR